MHQISERDIEQASRFEALKISALNRERQRVLEELRSKIVARAGVGSPTIEYWQGLKGLSVSTIYFVYRCPHRD
jgi:hypothetical protein